MIQELCVELNSNLVSTLLCTAPISPFTVPLKNVLAKNAKTVNQTAVFNLCSHFGVQPNQPYLRSESWVEVLSWFKSLSVILIDIYLCIDCTLVQVVESNAGVVAVIAPTNSVQIFNTRLQYNDFYDDSSLLYFNIGYNESWRSNILFGLLLFCTKIYFSTIPYDLVNAR